MPRHYLDGGGGGVLMSGASRPAMGVLEELRESLALGLSLCLSFQLQFLPWGYY